MARPPWKPGDPCRVCRNPIAAQSDRYKRDQNLCRPCGNKDKQEQRDKERQPLAIACPDCRKPMLNGNDRRFGACATCRKKAKVRYCDCGEEIAAGSKSDSCATCITQQRIESARKGSEAMVEKRRQERELREATRGPAESPRPIAQAWPGLRGPGGEWEKGPTSVQSWATLDGRI